MPLYVPSHRRWQRYLIAICAVAMAALVRSELLGILGPRVPYVTFFPAVMLVALFSGVSGGLLATFLSATYISYWLEPVGRVFVIQSAADSLGMAIFIMSCVMFCFIADALHRAQRRAGAAEAQVLLAEQRAENEARLQETEGRYRVLFENSLDAIFLTVPNGEVTAANPAACAIFGAGEAELCRIGRAGVIDQTDPRFAVALQQRAEYGEVRCELTCVRKDGTRFPAEVNSVVLDDGCRSFVILRDITKRKTAEAALKNYAQRLIVTEEDLRKKIACDLHDDIGQMLTALGLNLGSIGNLVPKQDRDKLGSRLDDSRQLTKEISRTVRDLMVELRPSLLDDYGLVEATRSHLDQYAQRTGIEVTSRIDEDFPRLSEETEMALFRIIQEALNNVAKHAAAGKVSVSLGREGGRARLSISDNGKGFLPHAASPLPTRSGWGLTIMEERAKLIGARFRLETISGAGTTIVVEMEAGSPPDAA